jgi:hypothetical protein
MHRALALIAVSFLSAAARAGDPVADDAVSDAWGPSALLAQRFASDRDEVRNAFALPLAADWLDREDHFLAEWETRLDAAASGWDRKPTADRVDHVLLRESVRGRRAEIGFDRRRREESLAVLPFAPDLADLERARRRMEPVAPKDAASRLDAARKSLADVRGKVEKAAGKKPEEAGPDGLAVSAVVARRAAGQLDALRGTIKSWFSDRDGFEPEFGWWCRKPWQDLDAAMGDFATYLRDKIAGGADALVGDPIGADALRDAIAREFLPYTPQELLAIADREMAWCEAEARRCAQEMGLGDDWRKALERIKQETVDPGRQDELVAAQAREAIEFVTSKDLVTVPPLCRDVWGVHMIPEGQQKFTPYAYYAGREMGVAYPSDAMEHERKLQSMRGNNVRFSRIVTPHELIPGHHLQFFQAERHRAYRREFSTPFLVEGWALYWEMRLWELGWAKSPEDRMGMLFWRMHRCARITVSLKFHLGEMTPQQMIDFLVDRVGHEKDGATAEVRRYIAGGYGPLYQVAYMLGGLQLRALHRELVVSGKMTERAFHDAVLRQGPIPVRLVRAALTDEPIPAAGPAPWRFAD